jgi:hypothetical protein
VYDGLRGAVRPVALRAVRDWAVCADARGRGDSVELPCQGGAVLARSQ